MISTVIILISLIMKLFPPYLLWGHLAWPICPKIRNVLYSIWYFGMASGWGHSDQYDLSVIAKFSRIPAHYRDSLYGYLHSKFSSLTYSYLLFTFKNSPEHFGIYPWQITPWCYHLQQTSYYFLTQRDNSLVQKRKAETYSKFQLAGSNRGEPRGTGHGFALW